MHPGPTVQEALMDHGEPLVERHRPRGHFHRDRGEHVRSVHVGSGADHEGDVESFRVGPHRRVVAMTGLDGARHEEVVDRASERLGGAVGRLERDAEGQQAAAA